jgi:hypothetical protein
MQASPLVIADHTLTDKNDQWLVRRVMVFAYQGDIAETNNSFYLAIAFGPSQNSPFTFTIVTYLSSLPVLLAIK